MSAPAVRARATSSSVADVDGAARIVLSGWAHIGESGSQLVELSITPRVLAGVIANLSEGPNVDALVAALIESMQRQRAEHCNNRLYIALEQAASEFARQRLLSQIKPAIRADGRIG